MTKKRKGINGRTSAKEIENRRDICLECFKLNPNISKKRFIAKVKKLFEQNGIQTPTDQTINNDLKALGIDFKNRKKTHIKPTNFHLLGDEIHKKLRQIRVSFNTYNVVLFDYEEASSYQFDKSKEPSFRFNDKEDFLYKLFELIDKGQLQTDTLFKLSIILKEKGLERYIANVFDNNFFSPKPYLYSEIHDYCTVIVFEYKKYEEIMDSAYKIVEDYLCQ